MSLETVDLKAASVVKRLRLNPHGGPSKEEGVRGRITPQEGFAWGDQKAGRAATADPRRARARPGRCRKVVRSKDSSGLCGRRKMNPGEARCL